MKNKIEIVALLLVTFFVSCTPIVDKSGSDVGFIVRNESQYNVKLYYFLFVDEDFIPVKEKLYTISNNSEIKIYYYPYIGEDVQGMPLGVNPDSVYITFNNERRIIYRRNDQAHKGILDIGNYQEQKVNDGYFIYTYTITKEDYDNAKPIVAKK